MTSCFLLERGGRNRQGHGASALVPYIAIGVPGKKQGRINKKKK
jgi:hypothetical protein